MSHRLGFTADGEERLRHAINEQVRRDFAREIVAATDHWARAAVEKRIEDEVKRRMSEVSSPQSLWSAL